MYPAHAILGTTTKKAYVFYECVGGYQLVIWKWMDRINRWWCPVGTEKIQHEAIRLKYKRENHELK